MNAETNASFFGRKTDQMQTISDRIQNQLDTLTRAERQLALAILENYPVSGLGPLSALAKDADVSSPTVVRMTQKLGFKGYPECQEALRDELKEKVTNPIARHESWSQNAPSGHMLNRFTEAVIDNIRNTLAQVDPAEFDKACAMMADTNSALYIVGGRITHTLAEYLFLHMQMMRADVTHIESTSNTWPHYLLDVKEEDVFVIFDMRRYENNTLKLAEMIHERGARIVLFTDQWRSPVSAFADICFSNRIVVPSAWDSATTTLLLVESLISAAQDINWEGRKDRMEKLEDMFDQTKLFRKFT